MVDYEIFFPGDKNKTKSSFYFQKFGNISLTTSISRLKLLENKACAMHALRLNNMFSI